MNTKEREALVWVVQWGSDSSQREKARTTLRATVDEQNARESTWSLVKLRKAIEREASRSRSTREGRLVTTPIACPLPSGAVEVFDSEVCGRDASDWRTWRLPREGAEPFYRGSLCNYWYVTLGGKLK